MMTKALAIQARDALVYIASIYTDRTDQALETPIAALQAAIDAPEHERVFLVATGEVHEGEETYTRHDVRPPLCDAEALYLHPPEAPVPEGWRLAPVEPTQEMRDAVRREMSWCLPVDIYKKMLAAAPKEKP